MTQAEVTQLPNGSYQLVITRDDGKVVTLGPYERAETARYDAAVARMSPSSATARESRYGRYSGYRR